jgi:hypothetical protein
VPDCNIAFLQGSRSREKCHRDRFTADAGRTGDTPAGGITGILTLCVRLTIILDRKGASV